MPSTPRQDSPSRSPARPRSPAGVSQRTSNEPAGSPARASGAAASISTRAGASQRASSGAAPAPGSARTQNPQLTSAGSNPTPAPLRTIASRRAHSGAASPSGSPGALPPAPGSAAQGGDLSSPAGARADSATERNLLQGDPTGARSAQVALSRETMNVHGDFGAKARHDFLRERGIYSPFHLLFGPDELTKVKHSR